MHENLESRAEQSRAEQSRAEQSRAEQFEYLDVAKGIGIILVIFGHLSQPDEVLRTLVYSFHMPLFFLISGFLDHKKAFKTKFVTGFKKLVVPVYYVLCLDAFISLAQYLVGMNPQPTVIDIIQTIILYQGLWKNYPVWFLMTLFLCRLLHSAVNEKIFYCLSIVCGVLCLFGFNKELPAFWLYAVLGALPFFAVGVYMQKSQYKISAKVSDIIVVVIWIVLALVNGPTDMYQQQNGVNWFLFFVTGITGSFTIILLSKLICDWDTKSHSFFNTLGKHSLTVMLTHYYICRIVLPKALNFIGKGELYNNLGIQLGITAILAVMYYFLFKNIDRRKRINR